MTAPGRLEDILIVGGGTAGWMAAAYLNRAVRHTGCRVALVESADIGTIGVGEATVPPLVRFVRDLRLDEAEFMRHCGATYKLGIRFLDWIKPGHEYWHPFGPVGGLIDGLELFHSWVRSMKAGRREGAYSSYSLQALLGQADKGPRPVDGSSPIIDKGTYAYHLDAAALAAYLRGVAVGGGVAHLIDDVTDVAVGPDGGIGHLRTKAGRTLTADLFVDCTGFRGRLIEQALGDPWVDWSHHLLCDRAVVVPLARDDRTRPYTLAHALSAGWMWQIPLSHRVGCGYVHSSAHISEEAATRELIAVADPAGTRLAEPHLLKIRVGRRQNGWVKNCVSVGLASGFIEPLESTGLFFIQRALELLGRYLPDKRFDPALTAAFNRRMVEVYEEVRDFITLHYALSRRTDTAFWRDAQAVPLPDSLQATVALYDEAGVVDTAPAALFPATSWHLIFAGGGRLPRRVYPPAEVQPFARVCEILEAIKAQNREWLEELPSHREVVDHIHQTPS